jgi:cystathionine beta-lyase/cystathionine gamma-synthase
VDGEGPRYRFDTRAVQAGAPPFTILGAHPTAMPIVGASSYWYDSADELDHVLGEEQAGYTYGRYDNPTVAAFEQAIAALEDAPLAVAFASGMAAVHAAVMAGRPRSDGPVFVSQDCYGGTFVLMRDQLREAGVDVRFVDVLDLEALARRVAEERPSALLVEVISNPLERVADLEAIGALARRHRVHLIVDSTFTTPYLVRPLGLGASTVVHSVTKYLGGHGDLFGGVVVCASQAQADRVRTWRKYTGAILGPMDAYLALRGLRTLGLRMGRQCANALAVARALERHARVERVFYPGLEGSPDHALARRLFGSGGAGAVLAFAVRDADKAAILRLMERLRLVRAAPTLGDCYSLVLYPVIASHRGLSPDQRRALGITDNVLRFSAGIEDPIDLIEDFTQALG